MVYILPKYPDILTDKDWQKKKGLLAKGTGETGVGDAMDAAEKVYYTVTERNCRNFDISLLSPSGKNKTPASVGEAFKGILNYYKINVENDLCLRVNLIAQKAKAAATTWEKKALVPASSVKHAKAVVKAAEDYISDLAIKNALPKLTEDYNQALTNIETNLENSRKGLETLMDYIQKVESGIKTVKTKAEFDGVFWKGHIRGVGTQLPVLVKDLGLAKEMQIWRDFASEGFKPANDDEVPKKLKQVALVLTRIKNAAESAN